MSNPKKEYEYMQAKNKYNSNNNNNMNQLSNKKRKWWDKKDTLSLIIGLFMLAISLGSLFIYSAGKLTLTDFLIKNIEQDENGYYLVEDNQEVEIIIKSDYKYRLYIGTFEINGIKYFPSSMEDENLVARYVGYEKDEYIVVKYKINKNEDTLVLGNVETRSSQFFDLGNKFNYNNKNTIHLKIK